MHRILKNEIGDWRKNDQDQLERIYLCITKVVAKVLPMQNAAEPMQTIANFFFSNRQAKRHLASRRSLYTTNKH